MTKIRDKIYNIIIRSIIITIIHLLGIGVIIKAILGYIIDKIRKVIR